MEKVIAVEHLCKTFHDVARGPVEVVKDLSFSCGRGEILGLLGPNGAGKTTTLRLISALLAPTSGAVTVAGFDTAREPLEVRRRIGFISGDTNLYDRLTPRETVTVFGRFFGMEEDAITERSGQLFRLLGMEKILDRHCRNLSTGEKQKTSIARTLIHDPPVLILDEATTGLDVLTSRDILWMVKDARAKGKSIIYSAHDMVEVEHLCDRILLIHEGRALDCGTIPDVVERAGVADLTEAFLKLVEKVAP